MIAINDIRIGSKYWFDLGEYYAFGIYAERDGDIIIVDEALIYISANKNRFFFEERLLIDAPRLKNITINFSDMHEDNTEYYANYDYLDKLKKQQ